MENFGCLLGFFFAEDVSPKIPPPCIDCAFFQVYWNVRVEPSDFGVGVESIMKLVGVKAFFLKRDSPF